MIFPIGDDQIKGGHFPYVSYVLIALNVLVFLFQFSLPPEAYNAFIVEYGSIPVEIMRGEDYFTLITSMFMHGGWMHLIGNMLFLYIFADNIEASIGSVRFTIFYFLGGFCASAAHIMLNQQSGIPCVGASGAISAVLGAYLVMFSKSRVKVLVIYIFRVVRVPALLFLGFWIGQQLVSGIGSLGVETAQSSGTAWWAHIGGFVFGLVAGYYFKEGPLKGELHLEKPPIPHRIGYPKGRFGLGK